MISPVESANGPAGDDEASFPALPFASCFAYLPGGSGSVCEEGRVLCARLKAADRAWLPRLAARVWLETIGHGRFGPAFGARVVLVPVPGSAPLQSAHWVGERLAWCLKEVGLAAEVWPVLRRRYAVRKSAFAAAGERPTVLEHYASFSLEGPLGVREHRGNVSRLTLVDDVITRGRTLLAAAARIHAAFPGAEVSAFALLRTLDPCEGDVRWISGDARRRP
jgi:predicted amidophosphoribosyltransferase